MASANQIGTFNLIRQVKPRARWGDSPGPVYDPNWIVEFRLPGNPVRRESSKMPICDRCLSETGNPTQTRPDCRIMNCQTDVRRWADIRLSELAGDWKENRLKPKAGKGRLMLSEVLAVYRAKGPADKEENARLFEQYVNRVTGRPVETIAVDELEPSWWRSWARMYQEYARRGWTEKGKAPANAWSQLRTALSNLPVLDYETVSTANTTIKSIMAKVKSIFGPESRSRYLVDLEGRWDLPKLEEWRATKLSVVTPDTTFRLPPEVYTAIHEEHPKLKATDLQMWLAIAIMRETGLRPGELVAATTDWLEVSFIAPADQMGPPERVVYLVIKNRDGSFRMKSRRSKQERVWPLSGAVVEAIEKLAIPGGSILGLSSDVDADEEGEHRLSRRSHRDPADRLRIARENLLRRTSTWLRKRGVKTTQTNYNFRKIVGTIKGAKEGAGAVAVALGHSNEDTGQRYYIGKSVPIEALSPDDLAPMNVVGTERVLWRKSA